MKNKSYIGYHRNPKTTNERRANGSRKDRNKDESGYNWTRGKRKKLPDERYDIKVKLQKSWKKKRKTQYYCGGRGKKYIIDVYPSDIKLSYGSYLRRRGLQDWFEQYNIPFTTQMFYSTYVKEYVTTHTWEIVAREPIYECGKFVGLSRNVWAEVELEKPIVQKRRISTFLFCRFTYWSKKPLTIPEF